MWCKSFEEELKSSNGLRPVVLHQIIQHATGEVIRDSGNLNPMKRITEKVAEKICQKTNNFSGDFFYKICLKSKNI